MQGEGGEGGWNPREKEVISVQEREKGGGIPKLTRSCSEIGKKKLLNIANMFSRKRERGRSQQIWGGNWD